MIPVFTLCAFLFLLLTIVVIVFDLGNNAQFKMWYVFFFLSLVCAFLSHVITLAALAYVLMLACISFLYCRQKKIWQLLLLILISLPLFFHLPQFGFHNYPFLDHIRVTPDAVPYSLYFNYDKTLLPVFVMGFSEMAITRKKLLEIMKQVFVYLLLLAPLMLGLSWLFQYVSFCPKWPVYTPVWMLVNLFFTCTAEEILFRKIIQERLQEALTLKHSGYVAIAISAILFGAMHFMGGSIYIILATVAGLFYGHIFYVTRDIRSSMFLHFLLNMLHFLLFTYPALEG